MICGESGVLGIVPLACACTQHRCARRCVTALYRLKSNHIRIKCENGWKENYYPMRIYAIMRWSAVNAVTRRSSRHLQMHDAWWRHTGYAAEPLQKHISHRQHAYTRTRTRAHTHMHGTRAHTDIHTTGLQTFSAYSITRRKSRLYKVQSLSINHCEEQHRFLSIFYRRQQLPRAFISRFNKLFCVEAITLFVAPYGSPLFLVIQKTNRRI